MQWRPCTLMFADGGEVDCHTGCRPSLRDIGKCLAQEASPIVIAYEGFTWFAHANHMQDVGIEVRVRLRTHFANP